MRFWRASERTLARMIQEHPPRFVESLMLFLASFLLWILAIAWDNWQQWPYWVLSLSYSIGASTSFIVRETWIEPSSSRLTPVTVVALVFLLMFIFGLGYTVRYAIAFSP